MARWLVCGVMATAVIYVASFGPYVFWDAYTGRPWKLRTVRTPDGWRIAPPAVIDRIYDPLKSLVKHPIGRPLKAYRNWWLGQAYDRHPPPGAPSSVPSWYMKGRWVFPD